MKNITVRELLIKGDEDIFNLFQFVAPKNVMNEWKGTRFWDLAFHEVAELKRTERNVVRQFEIVFKIKEADLFKVRITDFFPAYNWINKEFETLNRLESQLEPIQNEKLKKAGVDQLEKLKEMNIIIPIAERFSKHPDEIAEWRYGTIYTILLKENIEAHINHRLSNMK